MNPFKFTWTLTFAVLFVTVSLARSQLFYHGRRLRIAPKECSSSSRRYEDLSGVCMFNLECQEKAGTVIGACVDQFLFGACCHIPNYTPPSVEADTLSGEALNERSTFPSSSLPETTLQSTSSEFIDANSSPLNNLYNVSFDASATLQPMGNWNLSKLSVGAFSSTSEYPQPDSTPSTVLVLSSTGGGGGENKQASEFHSARFPPRPSLPYSSGEVVLSPGGRLPPGPRENEEVDALHRPDLPLPVGERATPPAPPAPRPFLPLTLETFTSLSDPIVNRDHGNHAHVHHANGQSHLPVEPTALTLVTRVFSNNSRGGSSETIIKRTTSVVKPYILSSSSSISGSGSKFTSFSSPFIRPALAVVNSKFSYIPTTESPPKLSTFMYVDGDLPQGEDVTTNSITENTNRFPEDIGETTETDNIVTITEQLLLPAQEKIGGGSDGELNEDLNSNTENVWSVVMQLGPHHTSDPSRPPEVVSGEAENDFSHLPIIASTIHSSTAASNVKQKNPGPSALPLLATVLEAANAEAPPDTGDDDIWRTTLASVDKDVSQDLKEDDDNDDEDSTESDGGFTYSTKKPWASSTYTIHTFQYPDHNQTYSSEEDSGETTSYTSNLDDKKKNESINEKNGSLMISNGLMTWLSVDGNEVTTEKESPTLQPEVKEDDSAQEMMEIAAGIKNSAFLSQEISSTTTTKKTTTTTSTTTTTTTTPATTTTQKIVRTTKPTTTTTTTTTTPRPTTVKSVTQKSTKLPSRATTTKWKRPSQYTLPPEKKRHTTRRTTTTTVEPETRKPPPIKRIAPVATTTTTTTPRPKLVTKAPTPVTKSTTPVLLAEEDIDTNLDYLVDQVVQNMAESLSGSDLDEVIKHPHIFDSSAATVHPDQASPDANFPFPIVNNGQLLTKGKNKASKEKATTRRPSTTTQRTLDYRKDCGVRMLKKSGRIVGGTASKFGQWPWQALVKEATWLGLFSKNKCGGVLIAPKYVLTAAHCQPGFLATLTVVLGDFDISSGKDKSSSQSVTKNVRRVIVHRDYNAQTFENDIALLELESAVEFAPHIVPVCLPDDDEDFVGQQAFVTGWGRLKYGGGVPQILHEVDVPVLTNDNCQEMFQKSGHLKAIRESFICAGYAEGLKDSCEGDSGGPLSIKRETGQWVLAGTVSHGIKCAYPNLPGVYMRMTYYKPWIKKVTGLKT